MAGTLSQLGAAPAGVVSAAPPPPQSQRSGRVHRPNYERIKGSIDEDIYHVSSSVCGIWSSIAWLPLLGPEHPRPLKISPRFQTDSQAQWD